ncbi:unnamed protein product [Urochloa humidicola]
MNHIRTCFSPEQAGRRKRWRQPPEASSPVDGDARRTLTRKNSSTTRDTEDSGGARTPGAGVLQDDESGRENNQAPADWLSLACPNRATPEKREKSGMPPEDKVVVMLASIRSTPRRSSALAASTQTGVEELDSWLQSLVLTQL